MKNLNLADLPATKNYMLQFTKEVFDPIIAGQSNALITIPNFGAKSFIKYLLEHPEVIGLEFKQKINESSYLFLEINGIQTKEELWSLIGDQLNENIDIFEARTKVTQDNIIKSLKEISKQNKNIVIIINSAEEILNNKKIIANPIYCLASLTSFIKFIPIFYQELSEDELIEIYSSLKITNSRYLEVRSNEDMKVLIEKEERWYSYTIPPKVKERIVKLAGGYSSLARALLSLANKNYKDFLEMSDKVLSQNQTIAIWLMRVYQSLSDASKNKLAQLLVSPKLEPSDYHEYLTKTGIVKQGNNKIILFTPLFEHFLRRIAQQKKQFNEVGKKIFFLGLPLDEILSNQEYQVLERLWKGKNRVVTRENLARIMWGKNWKEKYSDWAIDRVVHKIRNKLGDSERQIVQTLKGKGFKLITK
ncbi:MAG: winged helix-turn-helix domain-containing protein [Candidatus Dojkabacteria bacterium]|jgi:hypothetical protein|nr:winged helix-turn-helix domain-containing protein [Candidatus Dojkabacteria bacterium]